MKLEYAINAKNKKTGEKLKCLIKLTPCDTFKMKFETGKAIEATLGHSRATELAKKITYWYLQKENIEIIKTELKELLTATEKYAIATYINVNITIVDNKTYLPKTNNERNNNNNIDNHNNNNDNNILK